MLEREAQATEDQKMLWRQETVAERSLRVSTEVFQRFDGVVSYGPFAGLRLSKNAWWGKTDLGAMVLGLYELEILKYIETLPSDRFKVFIDIGAADGYYACGLLRSAKVQKAICFESSEAGQKVIRENWIANGSPGDLDVFAEANDRTLLDLHAEDLESALVLIDIEGSEFEVLSDAILELLAKSTVIVEIHNWVDDFLAKYESLLLRASKYFDVAVIDRVDRPTAQFEELRDYTDDNRLLLVSERRPCQMRFVKFSPISH